MEKGLHENMKVVKTIVDEANIVAFVKFETIKRKETYNSTRRSKMLGLASNISVGAPFLTSAFMAKLNMADVSFLASNSNLPRLLTSRWKNSGLSS